MDFADVVLTVGLPVAGAILVPGPLGGMIGGAVGGAIGGYLNAKVHGENSQDTFTSTAFSALMGGLGGRLGGKVGAKLLEKVARDARAGWIPVNTFAKLKNTVGPGIPQAVLAGAGSGWARSILNHGPSRTNAEELPALRKPSAVAPQVDNLYNQLPDLFGRASSVLGGAGPASKYVAAPVASTSTLRAPQERSGIPNYDTGRRSLDDSVATTAANDRRVADAVRVAATSSAEGHTALANTVATLNRGADVPVGGVHRDTYFLNQIDRAASGAQQILQRTQDAGTQLARSLPAATV
ncbi:hypothetical protein [Nocardia sp. N2S4-5]|uniref:hypothetical protein n=1 Tax=Nocardia sp. N2S4-5 TaxID=3351565 RepID=UPI0037D55DD7